jgi:hypothetical protein
MHKGCWRCLISASHKCFGSLYRTGCIADPIAHFPAGLSPYQETLAALAQEYAHEKALLDEKARLLREEAERPVG